MATAVGCHDVMVFWELIYIYIIHHIIYIYITVYTVRPSADLLTFHLLCFIIAQSSLPGLNGLDPLQESLAGSGAEYLGPSRPLVPFAPQGEQSFALRSSETSHGS